MSHKGEIAIEAIGVSKSYGSRRALDAVDLTAYRGEVHGLLGPNGAGKTTLMRVLLSLVRRDSGSVRLLGGSLESTLNGLPDDVSGIVDFPAFYPYMSGRQNLAVLERLDRRASASHTDVERVLAQTGLVPHADVKVSGYSSGMRQRLGIASALLRSPRLLLLDEPTSSLDPAGARDVRDLTRDLANHGVAVLLSSHDMTEVEELCSRLTVIDEGRVVFTGTIDELRRRTPADPYTLRTSDDDAAAALAFRTPGVRLRPSDTDGFDVLADRPALDALTIALGRAGIAIRGLERHPRSLESLFFELIASGPDEANRRRGFSGPVRVPEEVH